MEMMSKEIIARIFQPTCSHDIPDGSVLIERHEIINNWTRVKNEWILIKDEQTKTFNFENTIYSGQELIDRLLLAGFSEVLLFGNLDGDEYNINAKRLVALATK